MRATYLFFLAMLSVCILEATHPLEELAQDLEPTFQWTLSIDEASPEDAVKVILEGVLPPGHKIYWSNPGDMGLPTQIFWTVPDGVEVSSTQFSIPTKYSLGEKIYYAYEGSFSATTTLTLPPQFQDRNMSFEVEVDYLMCNEELCLPDQQIVRGNLADVPSKPSPIFPQKIPLDQIRVEEVSPQAFLLSLDATVLPPDAYVLDFYPQRFGGIDVNKQVTTTQGPNDRFTYFTLTRKASPLPHNTIEGLLVFTSAERQVPLWIDLPISARALSSAAPMRRGGEDAQFSLMTLVLFGFLGGLILNLMPCVLPVVSLKVLSFVQMSQESRWRVFVHALLFSLGVLVSFWALASVLLLLRSWGHAVGWGFQLQDPRFVAVLASILLLCSLWLFGVFELGMEIASTAGNTVEKAKKNSSVLGAFFSGVLATLVATPCSGPFLGTALGVAVTLDAGQALLIFTALGIGMSSPYLLLALFPKALKWIPRPGPWMDTFKQLLGFLMLLTTLWLVYVFVTQTDSGQVFALFVALFLLSFAAWVVGQFTQPVCARWTRRMAYVIALSVTLYSYHTIAHVAAFSSDHSTWTAFSKEKLDALLEQDQPVFIDFTATWCLLCQSNHVAIESFSVQQKMQELGVIKLLADWTKYDAQITQVLSEYERNSVPFYLYFPAGQKEPVILPQVLTPEILLEYLEEN